MNQSDEAASAAGPETPAPPHNPFLFRLSSFAPTDYPGGTLQGGNEQTFPILAGQDGAIYLLTLNVGGVREPHWHPSAWEANYIVSGRVRWSVLTTHPNNQYLHRDFAAGPGDLVFIPQGYFHYFENASDTEPLVVLIAFNASSPEPFDDIGIVASVSAMPDGAMSTVFGVPASVFAGIPKNFQPVVLAQRPTIIADQTPPAAEGPGIG